MSIEPWSEAVSNMSGVINQVVTNYQRYKDLKADENAYVRLLYMEVLHNLEILQMVKQDKLKSVQTNHRAFGVLVEQLSIEVMAGVFAPGGNTKGKLYDFLKKNGTINSSKGKEQDDLILGEKRKSDQIETTVLRSIVFVVIKIEALKAGSAIGQQDFLKQLVLKRRLDNIIRRLRWIKMRMAEFDKLDGIV